MAVEKIIAESGQIGMAVDDAGRLMSGPAEAFPLSGSLTDVMLTCLARRCRARATVRRIRRLRNAQPRQFV